ncbi:MAG: FHA domain-containing protein [Actinobacteria bacterium]|nr:FHA domain-containing protein [Actinomycetota bacterium]
MEINDKNNKTDSIKQQEIEFIKEISPEIMEELKKVSKGNAGLLVIKGPSVGEKFMIRKPVLTIGRSSESDILLDDITVSRHHAIIEKKESEHEVRDLESLNGTYLNGNIVNQSILKNGDRVQIGKYIFLFFSTV